MNDLMKELDRLDRETSLRNFDKRQSKKTRETHRLGSSLVVLLLLAGAGGVVYVATKHHSGTKAPVAAKAAGIASSHLNDSAGTSVNEAHLDGHVPTAGVGEHRTRLLPAVTPPAGTGGYTVLDAKYGPPRYDPCRAIHYVIRDQDVPPGGDADIRRAIALLSKATGLQFIDDGMTTEPPDPKRQAYQLKRYGDRWAPVLIAWTDPTHVPELSGDVAGIGGSQAWDTSGGAYVYVTGAIFLDAPQLTKVQAEPSGNVAVTTTIEHELGHVVGLGHVNDRTQIMYPEGIGQTGYGAGDLRGLAYEGSGACHPEL